MDEPGDEVVMCNMLISTLLRFGDAHVATFSWTTRLFMLYACFVVPSWLWMIDPSKLSWLLVVSCADCRTGRLFGCCPQPTLVVVRGAQFVRYGGTFCTNPLQ